MRHIATGVSTHPRGVMPVAGSFVGTAQDYWSLEAAVKTTELTAALHVGTPDLPPQPAPDPA